MIWLWLLGLSVWFASFSQSIIEQSYSQYLVGRTPGGIHSINPFVRSSVSSLHRFGSTSSTPRYPASVQLQQLVHTRVVQNWTLVQDDVGKSGYLASKIARLCLAPKTMMTFLKIKRVDPVDKFQLPSEAAATDKHHLVPNSPYHLYVSLIML